MKPTTLKELRRSGKNTNPSTAVKSAPIKKRWQDAYLNFRSRRLKPVSIEYLEEIGDKFIDYVFQLLQGAEDAKKIVSLERFLVEEGIPDGTMKKWRKRSKKLDDRIKFGLMSIGTYLEEGLLHKTLSEKATMYQLHLYLPRWSKLNDYQDERIKKVRDTEADKPTHVTVNMVDYSKKDK